MRLALTFLLSSCTCFGTATGAECPEFWTKFEDSCYALSQTPKPWTQANLICEKHGGHLVIIETAAENKFVTTLMKNTQVHHADAWIGAQDFTHDRNFTWVGTHQPLSFSDWGPGEPSDIHETCIDIRTTDGYKWNDQRCGSHLQYICERSPIDEVVG